MKPLRIVPVFRENDLFSAIFPEIVPLFKKGEEPSVKILYDFLAQQKGKKVMMDTTCFFASFEHPEKVTLTDFPAELGFTEIPTKSNGKELNIWKVYNEFHEKLGVDIEEEIIDSVITNVREQNFSELSVKALLEIAKKKNNNIKTAYILSDRIADHVGKPPTETAKQEVLAMFQVVVKNELGLDLNIVSGINPTEITETDLVIVDRHDALVSKIKLHEKLPRQILVLPLGTEMHNNEKYLGETFSLLGIAADSRKLFEVTT